MYTTEQLQHILKFIENKQNYYAGFGHVIRQCHVAREMKIQLWDAGIIGDNENLALSERIERAYRKAIDVHKKWLIKVLSDSETKHTIETLVSTIYHDIFD